MIKEVARDLRLGSEVEVTQAETTLISLAFVEITPNIRVQPKSC
jgi:hypothetical protein